MLAQILIGAGLVVVGYGVHSGRGKMIHRFPVLTQPQQGLILAGAGLVLIVWGLVAYL
jgi:hypothetical protein